MASSMIMTSSFFGGAVAAKPATATTRRSQLAVRASMDLEKAVSVGESSNTRRGVVLAGMAAAAASSVVKVAMADDAKSLIPGGWKPIPNPSAPEIFQIAIFAVSEHNIQEKTSLVLESVLEGYTQVVSGVNYRLVIKVRDESRKSNSNISNNYEAIVYSKAAPTLLQLTSFKQLYT
ncbi:cysteine proteinase inhibitor 5-like [Salvia divinorum]|uniref:Cysteine proteinase inhibitor 5-like n=1 Tax=Salvia divinorum TaxID=28513 RepID=A0ABD1GHG7_SALDI